MKRLLLAALLFCGCTSKNMWGDCIGIDRTGERKDREYRVDASNVIIAIVLIETIVVPAVVVLDQLYCPIGPKAVNP